VVTRYGAVHLGMATQTDGGLMVPVMRHAETLDLWACAAEIARLAEAARSGKAPREELSGSTITITSLGRAGRHRQHAGDQPPRGGHRRRQPHGRAPHVRPQRPRGGAPADEPVVSASTTAWSTAWTPRCSCSDARLLETPATCLWSEPDMNTRTTNQLLVIGGGPGGYVAAIRAAQLGIKPPRWSRAPRWAAPA
jgi:hypothetical protein